MLVTAMGFISCADRSPELSIIADWRSGASATDSGILVASIRSRADCCIELREDPGESIRIISNLSRVVTLRPLRVGDRRSKIVRIRIGPDRPHVIELPFAVSMTKTGLVLNFSFAQVPLDESGRATLKIAIYPEEGALSSNEGVPSSNWIVFKRREQ